MNDAIIAAIIGASGVIIAALVERVRFSVRRVEEKIDGLKNGTYSQALATIAELRREKEERRLRGLAVRRVVDHMIPPDEGSGT